MTFEVVSPEVGAVSIDIVGLTTAAEFTHVDKLNLVVLEADGNTITTDVTLVDKPSGRGHHRAFACPGCRHPALVLRAHAGRLCCARCRAHRTERQRQRSTRWWRREAGQATDTLLRRLLRRGPPRLEDARRLAHALVHQDEARLRAVMPRIRAALGATGGES